MGSNTAYPEEQPEHVVEVSGFWMDRYPVTNARFARFISATQYLTLAELPRHADNDRSAVPERLRPGSLVFVKPATAVRLRDDRAWWRFVAGADWRHPAGPASSSDDLADHPVVHVTYADAAAFAAWERKTLPTEAEWEFAARGGLEGATYAWGDDVMPNGRPLANYWQGRFPNENTLVDGWEGTSPVGWFPPNAYGLYDMIGNVWQWTAAWYAPRHSALPSPGSTRPRNSHGTTRAHSIDPSSIAAQTPRKVLKGGSHLCANNYCRRYRPAARLPEPIDDSRSDIGFRCIVRPLTSPAAAGGRSSVERRVPLAHWPMHGLRLVGRASTHSSTPGPEALDASSTA
jgi:formylglycine-generating enzyme required for sulfatase activity